MSTKQILPWHKTVGTFAADRARSAVAGFEPSLISPESFAALVAEHDPNAETARLLEQAILGLDLAARRESPEFLGYVFTADAIRAHLAKLRAP